MPPNSPTLAEVEEESIQDTILKVMGEAVGEKIDDEPDNKPDASDETTEASPPSDGRPRDEQGRFLPKDGKPAVAEPGTDPDEGADRPAGDGEPAALDEPIDPPHEWTVAEQEQFRGLTRPAQEFVLARINQAKTLSDEAGNAAKRYEGIERVLAPRRQAIAMQGQDEATWLNSLAAVSDFATRDPENFARWFFQSRGLNPQRVFAAQQQQPQVDPEIQTIRQQLGQFQNYLQQQSAAQQQQQASAVQSEITAFFTATDERGKPQHPYAEEVRKLMSTMMRSGEASDLKTAYDMACRAHPEVSAKIASADRARAERERAAEQRRKAEAARKAGSSISGTSGDRSAPQPSGDVREDLRRAFAEAGHLS